MLTASTIEDIGCPGDDTTQCNMAEDIIFSGFCFGHGTVCNTRYMNNQNDFG